MNKDETACLLLFLKQIWFSIHKKNVQKQINLFENLALHASTDQDLPISILKGFLIFNVFIFPFKFLFILVEA